MMKYNDLVETCFFRPRHVGTLDCSRPFTVFSEAGIRGKAFLQWYAACDAQGLIIQCCFKAYGNPYLIAALEWCCRQMTGTSVSEHPRWDYRQLVTVLEIPQALYPTALLVEQGYRQICEKMKQLVKENP
ncbi:hypothetical protein DIZ81_00590 [Legionella taurinensis]|uniref:NIF system FeS cluster assembly NifU N-terminal domain-containing protein n=1 Tax=Legionella taurinensis TaxID=70611 RepID=A0A3A5L7X9_9GAMM|nr:hypothetical protein [Legionella taurinensis]MDX1836628.1 hypothetical protein [Legionella taurinensis]PUT42915.1 hypothetical protein DB744_00595 [Legionella taurinensis]PUT45470.1 hypothetical protein DB746_00595 [Legionella taurinensis]PUT46955.1 hypothetical protein DB743_03405 [Legionella taurinensis]PUT49237.1 hypothetical protein DB745_00595 [Legionella taurinensis]